MLSLFGGLLLALPLLGTDVDDRDAIGCPGPPCIGWSSLSPVLGGAIPADGVFLFEAVGEGQPAITDITLAVTLGGVPVEGTLEATAIPTLLLWRPAQPWQPGMTYQADVSAQSDCTGTELGFTADITVEAAPAEALGEPSFTAVTSVQVAPDTSLASLVCCEGATPTVSSGCTGSSIYWDPAQCTPSSGVGLVVAEITGSTVGQGSTADQVIYKLRVDGLVENHSRTPSFYASSDAPMCVEILATNLGTGSSIASAAQCFGADVEDQLGPKFLDPTEVLSCDLQQCENNGDGTLSCHGVEVSPSSDTLNETDEGKGCECDADAPGGPGALALPGLLWLIARRRRPV